MTLLEAVLSFERADTEFRRAKNADEQPRLQKAGNRYASAQWRMFQIADALRTRSTQGDKG